MYFIEGQCKVSTFCKIELISGGYVTLIEESK